MKILLFIDFNNNNNSSINIQVHIITQTLKTKIRSIIREELKKVLNENAGREQAAQLIAAMNQIRGNYDSINIGQTVPAYKTDADVYMIKDFINQNVSGAVVDDYLEQLRTILAHQNLQLDYSTDDYSEEGYVTSLDIYEM